MLKFLTSLLCLLFLATSCQKSEVEEDEDQNSFGLNQWTKIGMSQMLIPSEFNPCYSGVSLKGDFDFKHEELEIFIGIDEFRPSEIEKFKTTHSFIRDNSYDDFTLNLSLKLREEDLYESRKSEKETVRTNYNYKLKTAIIEGKKYVNSDVLSYVNMSVELGNLTYLIQFACAKKNLKFYYQKMLDIAASIKSR